MKKCLNPACGRECGTRSRVCRGCGTPFYTAEDQPAGSSGKPAPAGSIVSAVVKGSAPLPPFSAGVTLERGLVLFWPNRNEVVVLNKDEAFIVEWVLTGKQKTTVA